MATLGFGDLKDTALPSLWDTGELEKIRLKDGTTMGEMEADVRAGLAQVNAALLSMPHYAALLSVNDDAELEYPIGVSNGVEEATEYGVPDPKRGATTGHMLPLKKWDRALGWTMMYLRGARAAKLDSDVASAIRDIRAHFQQQALTRLFKMEGEQVGSTANASVPLADGGTTDSTYVPPDSPEGLTFDATHDHFLRHDAISDANFLLTIKHLQEHGHASPFDVIAARADAASWSALTGFKNPEWPGIVYHGSATERAAISEISNYFGYIETDYGIARVWLTPRLPTAYYGLYKTYGAGDPRNPVVMRIDPDTGFGWRLVPGNWINAPQLIAVMYAEYGFGIGEDRTNGVCVEIDAAGDYATPTIS